MTNRAEGTALSNPGLANLLWCADYKGEFVLADKRYCNPLTITDFASRYPVACEALHTPIAAVVPGQSETPEQASH